MEETADAFTKQFQIVANLYRKHALWHFRVANYKDLS